MKKSDWQYLIDTLLFIFIMGIVVIGFLLGLVIPKGPSVAESSKYFLGLHRHGWGNIHFYLSIAFTALVLIHLLFSWKWIKNKAKQLFKKTWQTSLFIILLLGLITPLLLWNFWPKYAETYAGQGIGQRGRDAARGRQEAHFPQEGEGHLIITGQVTLADLEKATGMSHQAIIEKLDLPKRTKQKETLGQLGKRHGIDLQNVRDIITSLLAVQSEMPENKEEISEETEHENKTTRGRLAEDPSGLLVTGQMTLKDIQKQTGIPARILASKLGLPLTIRFNEPIGRLKRTYPITIQDVRDVVSDFLKKSEEKRI